MSGEIQNDEQARQKQANARLAWILGAFSAAVFFLMMYYLRAK